MLLHWRASDLKAFGISVKVGFPLLHEYFINFEDGRAAKRKELIVHLTTR